jgi:hypothetical protein
MRAVCLLALGAAALASTGATAQVISRSVNEEPVETIVTQTPTGTIVTRRPVATEAVPYGAAPVVVETGPNSVDAVTTREVVRRVETRPLRSRPVRMSTQTRTTTVRKSAKLNQTRATRREVVTRTTVRRPAAIALSPAERHIVYRTIVEREVVPETRVVTPGPVYEPPIVAEGGDEVAPAPAYETYPAYPTRTYAAPAYAATYPAYTVGSVLPANVPLYAVPQEVGYRVPAAQPYSYAYIGGRAYLVDPATSTIVADVTE